MQICCKLVPVDECSEVGKVSDYDGASQDDIDQDAALEQARADNPGKRILGVGIEDIGRPGKPCGKMRETWQGNLNCCDFVEPMTWDENSSVKVIAPGYNGWVFVNGGTAPYHWSIRGEGMTFDGYRLRDAVTDVPYIRVFAGPFSCGTSPVTVTDGCSTARGYIRATVGSWTDGCMLFYYNVQPSPLQDRWRPTQLCTPPCSLQMGEPLLYVPPPSENVIVSSYVYEWTGSSWQINNVDHCDIPNIAVMDYDSFMSALADLSGNINIVTTEPIDPPQPGDDCAYSGLSCNWLC